MICVVPSLGEGRDVVGFPHSHDPWALASRSGCGSLGRGWGGVVLVGGAPGGPTAAAATGLRLLAGLVVVVVMVGGSLPARGRRAPGGRRALG